ncbi:hypothetical protein [Pseudomonas juntendi]|nr:hypothetical protein [Pseudomonas juntendi]
MKKLQVASCKLQVEAGERHAGFFLQLAACSLQLSAFSFQLSAFS